MKATHAWLLLTLASVQFVATALPPGQADLVSIYAAALDLSKGETSFLYPGRDFSRNDEWITHHESSLRRQKIDAEPNWIFYPPLVPYVAAPFTGLSMVSWRLGWGAIQLLFIGLFVVMLDRLLRLAYHAPPNRVLLLALVLGSYPVAMAVALGQTSLVLAVLLWSGVCFAQRGSRFWSWLLAGLAIFVKPFLAVIEIVDAVRRRWMNLAGIAVTYSILIALSVAVVGIAANIDYVEFMATLARSQTAYYGNQSVLAGLLRVFSDLPVDSYGFGSSSSWVWVGRIIAVLVIGVTGWVQWKARSASPTALMGLWLSAALLAAPITWEHHLIFVLPVVAYMWMRPNTAPQRLALTLATLLLGVNWSFLYGTGFGGRLAANLPLLGNLILFLYLTEYTLKNKGKSESDLEGSGQHVWA
jgi:hypothetical protein